MKVSLDDEYVYSLMKFRFNIEFYLEGYRVNSLKYGCISYVLFRMILYFSRNIAICN